MLDVKVLKDLDWSGAVFLRGGLLLQDFLKSVDNVPNHKLILIMNLIMILFILFSEQPSIDSLTYRNLFSLKQPN